MNADIAGTGKAFSPARSVGGGAVFAPLPSWWNDAFPEAFTTKSTVSPLEYEAGSRLLLPIIHERFICHIFFYLKLSIQCDEKTFKLAWL